MKTLLLAAALAVPLTAVAQTDTTAPATPLNPVLVTATRTPQNQADTLADVTVLTRQQIEQSQVTDITDLLRFNAGIDIGRNGGPGQTTSIFMDGGNSNHTLVLIDGVRINADNEDGASALQNISPDMVERIEIVKGPSSTLYGSDAVAGVINIITRTGSKSGADVHLRAGSDNTKEVSGQFSYVGDGNQLSLLAQNLTTDGIPPCAGISDPGGYSQSTVNLNGSTQAGPIKIGARFWNSQGTVQYNNTGCSGPGATSQDYRNHVAEVTASAQPLANWQSVLSASDALDDIQQSQINPDGTHNYSTSTRPQIDWHNVLTLGAINRVSFGLQAAHESFETLSEYGAAAPPLNASYNFYNGFLQDEINSGRQHGVVAGSYVNYSTFGSHESWNAEYGYDVLTSTRVIAAAGTGFHAPTGVDLYGTYGNPDLKPEQTRSYELGLRQLVGTNQVVDVRVFRLDTTDLIEFNPSTYLPYNVDHARNQGVKLSYRVQIEQWSAQLAAISQNPEDRTSDTPLLRRAKQSLSGDITRHFGVSYVSLNVLTTGARPDIDYNTPTFTPVALNDGGYALLALSGGLQLPMGFSVLARVDNLLDKQYQTAYGYNEPGTTVMVTLRYVTP